VTADPAAPAGDRRVDGQQFTGHQRALAAASAACCCSRVAALVEAAPAQAGPGFGYTCDVTNAPDEELNASALDCDPQGGAPAVGAITREFKICARTPGPNLDCFGGGVAATLDLRRRGRVRDHLNARPGRRGSREARHRHGWYAGLAGIEVGPDACFGRPRPTSAAIHRQASPVKRSERKSHWVGRMANFPIVSPVGCTSLQSICRSDCGRKAVPWLDYA
jgi:hypothetical protein